MQLARLLSPGGHVVLARLDGGEATPLAVERDVPRGDVLVDLLLEGTDPASLEACGETFQLDAGTWLPPVQHPGKIIAVGLNYADHAIESNLPVPAAPMTFAKYTSSVIGHGHTIRFRTDDSDSVDYEGELAVIIGRTARDVAEDRALEHVFGYTACNDVSARDAQFADGQFSRAKSYDTFTPLGPLVVTADEIPDPQDLAIRARVNGQTVQDSSTKEMIFGVAQIVAYLSRFMTLLPGDVIATGTPAGVGMGRVPPLYLRDGDVVEVEIERIGTLVNTVSAT